METISTTVNTVSSLLQHFTYSNTRTCKSNYVRKSQSIEFVFIPCLLNVKQYHNQRQVNFNLKNVVQNITYLILSDGYVITVRWSDMK